MFKNIKLKYNPLINIVASTTFGVLCIHANSNTMRSWLWCDFLDNVGTYDSNLVFVHLIVSVILVFAVCSAIDYLRIKFVETPFFKVWNKKEPSILYFVNQQIDKICKKLNITNNKTSFIINKSGKNRQ